MNWQYTTVIHPARKQMRISTNEYCVLDIIYQSQVSPKYGRNGWATVGIRRLAEFFGLSVATIHELLGRMEKRGFMEIDGDLKRATSAFYDVAYERTFATEGHQHKNRSVRKPNGRCSETEQKCSETEPKYNRIEKEENLYVELPKTPTPHADEKTDAYSGDGSETKTDRPLSLLERLAREGDANRFDLKRSVAEDQTAGSCSLPDEETKQPEIDPRLWSRLNKKDQRHAPAIVAIVDYFRQVTGKTKTAYHTKGPLRYMIHWLNQGYELADFRDVIDFKTQYFRGKKDAENEIYVALDTYLRFDKFESNLERARDEKVRHQQAQGATVEGESGAGLPTPYDQDYSAYIDRIRIEYPGITAGIAYLSKSEYIHFRTERYRQDETSRQRLLKKAHDQIENREGEGRWEKKVFTLYVKLIEARYKELYELP